jgi:hypothetical protein
MPVDIFGSSRKVVPPTRALQNKKGHNRKEKEIDPGSDSRTACERTSSIHSALDGDIESEKAEQKYRSMGSGGSMRTGP